MFVIVLQVLQDFDIKFGTETASRLLEQWDTLKPKIIAEAKTLNSNLYLNSLLAAGTGQNLECEWQGIKWFVICKFLVIVFVVDLHALFVLACRMGQ